MADIRLVGVHTSLKRAFQAMGENPQRFDEDFLDAANRTINIINRDADLATRIARVGELAEDTIVTGLDEKYEDVFWEGIFFHLMEAGRRPAKGAEERITRHEDRFSDGVNMIRADIANTTSVDNDFDEDARLVGLVDDNGE